VQCKRVVSQLPRSHRNVFVYLVAFLREVLRHSSNNGLSPQDVGTCPVYSTAAGTILTGR
jgi:phosphatidylinositol-bisphosphatase